MNSVCRCCVSDQRYKRQQHAKYEKKVSIFINKMLNTNKMYNYYNSWRVADAHVVGRKNTNNGWSILLPKRRQTTAKIL